MALQAKLDTLDDLPEEIAQHYTQAEDGEGFVLDLGESLRDHPSAQGLKTALDKERQSRKDFEKKLREFEANGGESGDAELKAQLDEARKQLEESDRVIAQKDVDHNKMMNEVEISKATNEIGASKLFTAFLREKLAYDPDTGKAFVADKDGSPAIDDAGDPISITAFAQHLAETDPEVAAILPSKMKNGGGTPPGDRSSTTTTTSTTNREPAKPMNAVEKRNAERRAKIDAFRSQQSS